MDLMAVAVVDIGVVYRFHEIQEWPMNGKMGSLVEIVVLRALAVAVQVFAGASAFPLTVATGQGSFELVDIEAEVDIELELLDIAGLAFAAGIAVPFVAFAALLSALLIADLPFAEEPVSCILGFAASELGADMPYALTGTLLSCIS